MNLKKIQILSIQTIQDGLRQKTISRYCPFKPASNRQKAVPQLLFQLQFSENSCHSSSSSVPQQLLLPQFSRELCHSSYSCINSPEKLAIEVILLQFSRKSSHRSYSCFSSQGSFAIEVTPAKILQKAVPYQLLLSSFYSRYCTVLLLQFSKSCVVFISRPSPCKLHTQRSTSCSYSS